MFQMGHIGPMLGQAHHFLGYAPEKIDYAMNRYKNEANRLYGVVERRLKESKFLACDEYTIADMATMPWLRFPGAPGRGDRRVPEREALARRASPRGPRCSARCRCSPTGAARTMTQEQKENLFGAKQYAKR